MCRAKNSVFVVVLRCSTFGLWDPYSSVLLFFLFLIPQLLNEMSVNTAHANGGVLIHSGEYILLHCKNAAMEFFGQKSPLFQEIKHGHIYLTSHRMIFRAKRQTEILSSFSAPFLAMRDVGLQQPNPSASYIKGNVCAQPNGNYTGEVKFKLYLKADGAIQYAQALLCAASIALKNFSCKNLKELPSYTPPRSWYEAPIAAYELPRGYYEWLPKNDAFTSPVPNSVFMCDSPAPFPGIGTLTLEDCRELPLDPFGTPPESERRQSQYYSFGWFGQPPIFGKFKCINQDAHPAAFQLFGKSCSCPYDERSELTSSTYSGANRFQNFTEAEYLQESLDSDISQIEYDDREHQSSRHQSSSHRAYFMGPP